MSIREMIGLTFLIAGVVTAPFFYWLDIRWLVITFVLICIGAVLFYTDRMMRKNEELSQYPSGNNGTGNSNVPLVGAARGFPGHRIAESDNDVGFDGD